jgi:HEAT repeat protein
MDALDQRDYERALREFDQYYKAAGDKKDMRGDGALYWKAYTLHKLSRRDEALSTLALLEKTFPSSRWLNDAKALQIEVRQATGQGASPESQTDEDLKLLAIAGLMNTDAERVVPLLEKLLADPKTTPRLKTKALFVLGQSRHARAGEIIARYAKGGGNPDVQLKAVEYLGIYGTPQNKQVLSDVYSSTTDPALKRAVLRAYMIAKDKDKLLAAAKSESNVDLRREAIRYLGSMGAHAELAQLYSSETNADVKRTIVQSLGGRRDKTPALVASMYASESDKKLKTEMLRSLRSQGGAKELIEIARKEKDPSLKQEAVRELTHMNSKEAQDYLVELLNK